MRRMMSSAAPLPPADGPDPFILVAGDFSATPSPIESPVSVATPVSLTMVSPASVPKREIKLPKRFFVFVSHSDGIKYIGLTSGLELRHGLLSMVWESPQRLVLRILIRGGICYDLTY